MFTKKYTPYQTIGDDYYMSLFGMRVQKFDQFTLVVTYLHSILLFIMNSPVFCSDTFGIIVDWILKYPNSCDICISLLCIKYTSYRFINILHYIKYTKDDLLKALLNTSFYNPIILTSFFSHQYKGNQFPINYPCQFGDLLLVQKLHNEGWRWDQSAYTKAGINGHLPVIQYLHENRCHWGEHLCSCVDGNGHLNVLSYLHENGCRWYENTCSLAALNDVYMIGL